MSTKKIDYYTILQVPKTATIQQIKKAYKKLAIMWHPDKNIDNPDTTQKFRQISQAYQILSNQQKRKKYDLYGFDNPKSQTYTKKYDFSDAESLFQKFFASFNFGPDNTFYKYTKSTPSSHKTYYPYYPTYSTSNPTSNFANLSSNSTQKQQLPPQGQTITKTFHVTKKYANGTQQTIKRTTTLFSDGTKQINQQNLDGTNKKKYFVLGGTKQKQTQSTTSTSNNNNQKKQNKDQTSTNNSTGTSSNSTENKGYTTYTTSGTSSNNTQNKGYTAYTTSGTSSNNTQNKGYTSYTTSYPYTSYPYAAKKVYYADGTQAPYSSPSSSFGTYGSYGSNNNNNIKVKTRVYTIRK